MKWEMRKWGNEEMEKWGIEMGSRLLTFASAVIKGKSVSMYALTERSFLPDSWHQRGMQRALHHGLQASSMYLFFTFGSLLPFLRFVESVDCSYFVPT